MGDWTDAMDEGAICRGCAAPLGAVSYGGYCGPGCMPQSVVARTKSESESMLDRARAWKDDAEKK